MVTFTEFTFEAAHQVPHHSAIHGHSFKVQLYMAGKPDPVFGWSANLDEVQKRIEQVRAIVDHKYLNDIPGLEVPTLENIARWLWDRVRATEPNLKRVVVRRGSDGHGEGCIYAGGDAIDLDIAA